MNGTFHVRTIVPEDRPKLKALYDRLLGAQERQVLEAVREARTKNPILNRADEPTIVEKALARGVPEERTRQVLAQVRSLGILTPRNTFAPRMGIEADPLPAELFPRTEAELLARIRQDKDAREALAALRREACIAGLREAANNLRSALAPEVHSFIDSLEAARLAQVAGPAYIARILRAVKRRSRAASMREVVAKGGWQESGRHEATFVNPEETMAVGPPAAILKVAGRGERAPGRVEEVWQTDLGHAAIVRSAAGETTLSLERLVQLLEVVPGRRQVVLHCGADLAIILHVDPPTQPEEHAGLAPVILAHHEGIRREPGAKKLDVPELLDALNGRLRLPSGEVRPEVP